MARKKSIKRAAAAFISEALELEDFLAKSISTLSRKEQSWCHDYCVIRLYRCFEALMLSAIVGAINNNTSTISGTTGVTFPKHLTDEVCEYIVLGGGYFDFKGRDGLIKTLKKYVPDSHYVVREIKKSKYKDSLERLSALRNFAAHGGPVAKRSALKAINLERLDSSGAWLKVKGRYGQLSNKLKELAREIEVAAPY
jgi:hypothetical protein